MSGLICKLLLCGASFDYEAKTGGLTCRDYYMVEQSYNKDFRTRGLICKLLLCGASFDYEASQNLGLHADCCLVEQSYNEDFRTRGLICVKGSLKM